VADGRRDAQGHWWAKPDAALAIRALEQRVKSTVSNACPPGRAADAQTVVEALLKPRALHELRLRRPRRRPSVVRVRPSTGPGCAGTYIVVTGRFGRSLQFRPNRILVGGQRTTHTMYCSGGPAGRFSVTVRLRKPLLPGRHVVELPGAPELCNTPVYRVRPRVAVNAKKLGRLSKGDPVLISVFALPPRVTVPANSMLLGDGTALGHNQFSTNHVGNR